MGKTGYDWSCGEDHTCAISHVTWVTASLLPYPEGIRGGWVNTNIWLLGIGISLKKESPAGADFR
jgi:hypothetical protein